MWQSVATQANISADSVTNSVKAIVDNQEKIKLGQGNISGYQLLGINPNEDPFAVLDKLREKTQGLSQGMKKNVLGMLGVNAEMIQVLDLTNDQFDRMKKNAYVLSPGQIDMMARADLSIKMMGKGFDYIKAEIVTAFAPAIIKFMALLTSWMSINKTGFLKILQNIVEWVIKFITAIGNAGHMIDTIVKNTIGWKNALVRLVAGFALLNSAFLLSPIGLFSMACVALLIILDDMAHYFSGEGRSLMGDFMAAFPKFKKQFDDLMVTLKDVFGLLKALWNSDDITAYMDKLGDLGKKILLIKASLETFGAVISAAINTVIQSFLSFGDLIGTLVTSTLDPKNFLKDWQDYYQRLGGYGGSLKESFVNIPKTTEKSMAPLENYEAKQSQKELENLLEKTKNDHKIIEQIMKEKGISAKEARIIFNQTNNIAKEDISKVKDYTIDGIKKANTQQSGGNNEKSY